MKWRFANVTGIRQQPGSVGWKRILIAPLPPPKSSVPPIAIHRTSTDFEIPHGRITSSWETDDAANLLRLTCTIPDGAEAVTILPDESRRTLSVGKTELQLAWR